MGSSSSISIKNQILTSRQNPLRPDLFLKTIKQPNESKVIICRVAGYVTGNWKELRCIRQIEGNEFYDAEWSPNGNGLIIHGSVETHIYSYIYEKNRLEKQSCLTTSHNKWILLNEQVMNIWYESRYESMLGVWDVAEVNLFKFS